MKESTKYMILTYVCIVAALPFLGDLTGAIFAVLGFIFATLGMVNVEKENE